MIHLRAIEWFDILGRGLIAAIEPRTDINTGDLACIDGDIYEVRGIEIARTLTVPPRIKSMGLQVRPKRITAVVAQTEGRAKALAAKHGIDATWHLGAEPSRAEGIIINEVVIDKSADVSKQFMAAIRRSMSFYKSSTVRYI